jgi:hypothetical protein
MVSDMAVSGMDPIGDGSAAEQREGEPDEAYEAFLAYLRSPRPRQVTATARALGRPVSVIRAWAREWSWAARASAWDAECRHTRYEAVADAAADLSVEAADAARALTLAARARAMAMTPEEMSAREAIDAIKAGVAGAHTLAALAREAEAALPPPVGAVEGGAAGASMSSVDAAYATLREMMRPSAPPSVRVQSARAVLAAVEGREDAEDGAGVDGLAEVLARALESEAPEVQERVLAAVERAEIGGGQ